MRQRSLGGMLVLLFVIVGVVPRSEAGVVGNLDAVITKTDRQTTQQTDKVLWTPATGNAIVLMGCVFSTLTATITIELESSNVDVIPPIDFGTTASVRALTITGGGLPIWKGAVDAALAWSSSASSTASVMCWGYET